MSTTVGISLLSNKTRDVLGSCFVAGRPFPMSLYFKPVLISCRQPKAIAAAKEKYSAAIDLFIAEQYIFDKQWTAVKASPPSAGPFVQGIKQV